MSTLRKIRVTAAIILLCAIFLPLSECSRHEHAQVPPAQKSLFQQLFPQDNDDFVYQYASGVVKFSTWQAGGFALLALLWPFAALILDKKLRGRRFVWILYLIELLLCAGSVYWLYCFTAMGRWLYGAYVVCAAMAVLAVTTIILMVERVRDGYVNRPL